MADKKSQWGCCTNECETDTGAKHIKCPACAKYYHYACISLTKSPNNKVTWKCPSCLSKTPKLGRDDSTPVRNVSMTRGMKRQATEAPSLLSTSDDNGELRSIIREVIKLELSEMSAKFHNTIITTITKELAPIKKEMADIVESVSFINKKFEDIMKAHEMSKEIITKIESRQVALCAVYLPPPVCLATLDHFVDSCNRVLDSTDIPCYIIGDFNLSLLNWDEATMNVCLPKITASKPTHWIVLWEDNSLLLRIL
ncbi:hypothetical protein HW555_012563 [Spodoptera exigua]|uniref:PHD-type domain-containing protein n=1 Tax=Spodoptera exigua TaxID=7107 RepID=A0A835G4Q5_SPOEX|nr:hypothetical protein HW555_012563 [Spodoptera exigua]